MMRTIEFAEIYNALPEQIKSSHTIYSYVDTDIEGVKVIKANGVNNFFQDLMAADMVITVDSAAAHFREGLGLPAIALFNSFPFEIRTAGYEHVKSFNIKSECDMQPCFKHELSKGDLCPKIKTWQYSAPCFNSMENKYLKEQLEGIFEGWEW
jgi:ADP-heptose:LPS heptosyltransferase